MKTIYREQIEDLIIKLCKSEPKSVGELAKILDINLHTVRANYVYAMTKDGLLKKIGNHKFDVRYQSK